MPRGKKEPAEQIIPLATSVKVEAGQVRSAPAVRLAVSVLPHRSLIARGTIAEVRLTGLSFSLHESSAQEVQNGSS